MLVLTRLKDESIMIGDSIEVIVVEIRGDKVRLGITAPLEVPVHRKEVYKAILEENIAAAKTGAPDLRKVEEMLRENRGKEPGGISPGEKGKESKSDSERPES